MDDGSNYFRLFEYGKCFKLNYVDSPQPQNLCKFSESNLDLIGFDLETTGLSPRAGDRVVSVGAVRIDFRTGKLLDEYTTLINPKRPVAATFIHGISDEDVKDAPVFGEIYEDLLEFFKGGLIVGHNLRFDESFLVNELIQVNADIVDKYPSICTLVAAQKFLPNSRNHKLATCMEYLDIGFDNIHSAKQDALASAQLLQKLVKVADLEILIPFAGSINQF
jgi:DNA polymerase-3 subunit epsilon